MDTQSRSQPQAVDRTLARSTQYYAQASEAVAGGVNSNVRLAGPRPPLCLASGLGAHLTDIDGNRYIDYALGMGPAILGHAPRSVLEAVERSLAQGQILAGQTPAELTLARKLRAVLPSAELVRIGMTGSEMVQAALRVARAATGRTRFIKFAGHYHGWFDNVLAAPPDETTQGDADGPSAAPMTRGQAAHSLLDTVVLRWNDLDEVASYLRQHGADVAALIMEPVMCNTGVIPPIEGYLHGIRELCTAHGVVLIIDEVITGFRLSLGGAQQLFGVPADLSIYAKALGAGFPIAALTGRRELMNLIGSGAVNHSGTYNANTLSIAAAIAALDALAAADGAIYRHIDSVGTRLMEGIRSVSRQVGARLLVQGYPSVFNTSFSGQESIRILDDYHRCDEARQRRFMEALTERGVRPIYRGTWFVSAAHTVDDVDETIAIVRSALESLS